MSEHEPEIVLVAHFVLSGSVRSPMCSRERIEAVQADTGGSRRGLVRTGFMPAGRLDADRP